ncbi:MAG: hypothetical protein K6A92_06995 [Lachnospiraceae bacterium]|nr:hypothetical protein [Lachnospiraceae bacterium]
MIRFFHKNEENEYPTQPNMLEQMGLDLSGFDMDAVGRASVRKVYGSLPRELYGDVDYSYLEESDAKEWERFQKAVQEYQNRNPITGMPAMNPKNEDRSKK